jgi:hypothetical protein
VSTRVATTPAIRWYSDAPAAKEGEAAEKKEDAPAAPANDEAAKLKTDIEKKDKEIIELKVRQTNTRNEMKADVVTRTNTSAQSPTSATSKNAQRVKQRQRKTSPSSASPATS